MLQFKWEETCKIKLKINPLILIWTTQPVAVEINNQIVRALKLKKATQTSTHSITCKWLNQLHTREIILNSAIRLLTQQFFTNRKARRQSLTTEVYYWSDICWIAPILQAKRANLQYKQRFFSKVVLKWIPLTDE